MDRFDLEDKIMKCSGITEDLKLLLKRMDHGCTEDYMSNFLIGLVTIYEAKFNDLFDTFEDCVKKEQGNLMNINDEVYVKLTPYGKAIHKASWDKYMQASNFTYKEPDVNIVGLTKFPLWELMNIFGYCMYMGNTEIPFEFNEITVVL